MLYPLLQQNVLWSLSRSSYGSTGRSPSCLPVMADARRIRTAGACSHAVSAIVLDAIGQALECLQPSLRASKLM